MTSAGTAQRIEADTAAIDLIGLATHMAPPAAIDAPRLARELYGLDGESTPLHGERNANYLIRGSKQGLILKVAGALEDLGGVRLQIAALEHLAAIDPTLPVPRVIRARDGRATVEVDGRTVFAVSALPGRSMEAIDFGLDHLRALGVLVARLDRALRGFFHPWMPPKLAWDLRNAPVLAKAVSLIESPDVREAVAAVYDRFIGETLPRYGGLRSQFIHNDVNYPNVLVTEGEPATIAGIVDFGDMTHGPLIADLAVPCADNACSGLDALDAVTAFVEGYTRVQPLEEEELAPLHDAILARLATGFTVVAWRKRHDPAGVAQLAAYEKSGWSVLETLLGHGRDTVIAALGRAARRAIVVPATRPDMVARPVPAKAELIARRARVLGRHLSLSYDDPVHIVRGDGAWLWDADGRRYVDAYNNVPQVGHAHPRVVAAIARQAATLNTNTRYLHETVLEYAERLTATMGEGLEACIFVNSGSEANDVAWRMAQVWTGGRGGIVMANAYHGITEAVAGLSPYEVAANQVAPHVRTLAAPDAFRGVTGDDGKAAIASLVKAGLGPAMLMIDTGFTSNGIPDVPKGYLAGLAETVRAAGGLFVADEVQFGCARPGTHFWGYQHHGARPDIVTMGKPIADGHPLGVVVTRRDILDRFFEATGFFSTFGGNPVSAAAGLATLEVLQNERLQDNALTTGEAFRRGIRGLMNRHPAIGDVRGAGLLIGVEIVQPGTRTPDKLMTDRVKNRMREQGVLIGTEGVHGNILKIRPPLAFRAEHAAIALDALDRAFAGD
ncbi:MAG: aminotransferase class III-fold pyridoxal phosphate-dependent enzyme [Alphaproteobacteria bacterium]